jgi:hypothetical protein
MKHPVSRLALIAAFTASVGLAADAAGQAVPRHGGGGGSSSGSSGSSGGSSSGSSSSSGGSSSSSGSSSSGSSAGSSRGDSGSAPQRHAVPRHGSGGSRGDSGGSRAGRGGDSNGGSSSGGGAVRRNPGGSSSGRDDAGSSVPDYARPGREGRPTVGYAVPRGSVRPPVRPGGDHNYYYLSPYRWYYDPFAFGTFGLGYIYDPFWWGPGYGPYGYGSYGGSPYGYGYGYGYGHSSSSDSGDLQGALRIKAKPREAQVRVDGYFVGVVDDFDGNFQKLKLDDGPHKIELIADGYQPLAFDVLIVEGQTVTYKGQLQKR